MNIPVTPFENYVRLFYPSQNGVYGLQKGKKINRQIKNIVALVYFHCC